MNTNSVSSTGTALTDLIDEGDGQVRHRQGQEAVTGRVQQLPRPDCSAARCPPPAATTPTATPTPTPRAIDAVHVGEFRAKLGGFDFRNMDDPTISDAMTSKYKAARIFQDYTPKPESLPAVIEKLQRAGHERRRRLASTQIDFGDGFGAIDVIQGAYPGGGVAWQWIPQGDLA